MGEVFKKTEENKYGFENNNKVEENLDVTVQTTNKKFSWKQLWNDFISCMNIKK